MDADSLATATRQLAQQLSQQNGGLQQVGGLQTTRLSGQMANTLEVQGAFAAGTKRNHASRERLAGHHSQPGRRPALHRFRFAGSRRRATASFICIDDEYVSTPLITEKCRKQNQSRSQKWGGSMPRGA